MKLAQARGAVIAACGSCGLSVNEYAPRLVKKSVVGTGQADKHQVQAMLKVLCHRPKLLELMQLMPLLLRSLIFTIPKHKLTDYTFLNQLS